MRTPTLIALLGLLLAAHAEAQVVRIGDLNTGQIKALDRATTVVFLQCSENPSSFLSAGVRRSSAFPHPAAVAAADVAKVKAPQGHECYHCKQWIPKGVEHDCWTTTEMALTKDLPEDLRGAWERIRDEAVDFGEQRIYASLNSIMFAKKVCCFFVRPGPKRLEVVFFLGRRVRSPIIRRIEPASKVKFAHYVHVIHRDEIEPPLTEWLREAYDVSESLSAKAAAKKSRPAARKAGRKKR